MDITDTKESSTVYPMFRQKSKNKWVQFLTHPLPLRPKNATTLQKENRKMHKTKLFTITEKVGETGYGAIAKKNRMDSEGNNLIATSKNEQETKQRRKTETILQWKLSTWPKEAKSFFGAKQYVAKLLLWLPELVERITQILTKRRGWNWAADEEGNFNESKKIITEIPRLQHSPEPGRV